MAEMQALVCHPQICSHVHQREQILTSLALGLLKALLCVLKCMPPKSLSPYACIGSLTLPPPSPAKRSLATWRAHQRCRSWFPLCAPPGTDRAAGPDSTEPVEGSPPSACRAPLPSLWTDSLQATCWAYCMPYRIRTS